MDKQEQAFKQLQWDTEWVTGTEQGRRFMWHILERCGIYKDIEGEGNDVFKQIGRRQIGLYLLGLISDTSEEALAKMMAEARERSLKEKIDYERSNNSDTTSSYSTSGPGSSSSGTSGSDLDDLIGGSLPRSSDDTGAGHPAF